MTIEQLQQNLETWRQSKKSKRDRIPTEYWQAVINLTNTHSLSHLCSKLRLNPNDVKKRMGISVTPGKKILFQELPSVLPQQDPTLKIIFELSTSSGLTLKVYQ